MTPGPDLFAVHDLVDFREVNDFEVIVVDEVHERHLVVDFVLGILREAWFLRSTRSPGSWGR